MLRSSSIGVRPTAKRSLSSARVTPLEFLRRPSANRNEGGGACRARCRVGDESRARPLPTPPECWPRSSCCSRRRSMTCTAHTPGSLRLEPRGPVFLPTLSSPDPSLCKRSRTSAGGHQHLKLPEIMASSGMRQSIASALNDLVRLRSTFESPVPSTSISTRLTS